ncbi:carbohydrate ABC transporter permease [Microbacterium sp. VKM Ac-2870]|nr:sugar ABC transporter permease [Microbacterium sp. VKM Ac-2870]
MAMAVLGHRTSPNARRARVGWLLILPVLITVALIAIYPLVYTLVAAFTESSLGRPFQDFVGVDNFATALFGDGALAPLGRSLLFAVPSAVLALLLGFVIALSLDAAVRGGKLIRVLLLLPLMTPPVMAGVIWKLMYAPTGGLFNNIISGPPIVFLGSSPSALIALIVVDVWQWTPFCVLLIFAALQTLPHEVYEAAQVDGAGIWRTFRSVTLPLIAPSLVTVLLLKLIVSFKVFDLVFIMTGGGPGFDTTVSSFDIYRTVLQKFDLGLGAAQTLVFLVLVTLVVTPIASLRARLQKAQG